MSTTTENPTVSATPGKPYAGLNVGTTGAPQRGRDWRQVSKLLESLPPHAIEAEMSLLGSVLLDAQVLGDVIFIVRRGDDFFKPANGAIFDAMVELYDKHSSLDIVQLHQMLLDRRVLDAVGGQQYLIELAAAVPSASNAKHYARLVREKAVIRHLIGAAGDILYDAFNNADRSQALLDQAESRIFAIAQQGEQAQIESLADLIREEVHRIERHDMGQMTGIASGFHQLDELTTGFQKAEMVILAARPSMGKTAMALNLAENMAIRGKRVGFFSLEMSKQQLVQRLLCARAGIESQRMRRGMLGQEEFRALWAACQELQEAPIFVDDTAGLTMMQIRTKARRMVAKHKVDIVFIDYLQLLTTGTRTESRQVEVSEISRGVKAMARELNLPVICLSQLNRGPEDRTGNKPRMSDLRESGSLEQDADLVMLLHREDYYHNCDSEWLEANADKVGTAELILTKQRNGPTGSVDLSWISSSTRFRDYHPEPRNTYVAEPKAAPPFEPRKAAPVESIAPHRNGPVDNFRDGGGPDREEDRDLPPQPSDDEFDGLPI
jgi:replicative DNA helicase